MRGRVLPAEVVPGWQAQEARQLSFLPLIPCLDVMTLSRRWVFEIRSGAMVLCSRVYKRVGLLFLRISAGLLCSPTAVRPRGKPAWH